MTSSSPEQMSADGSPLPWQRARYLVACAFLAGLGAAALAGVADWPRAKEAQPHREGADRAAGTPTSTATPSLLAGLSAEPPPGADPAAALEEARLLDGAANALQLRQPQRALDLLDDYLGRHPAGLLARSERVLRVQAHLDRAQRSQALGVLDGMQLEPREARLLVTRGELRAELERCEEAVQDFSRALSTHPEPSTGQRALLGRAGCRAKLREVDGAREDYEAYLSLYPDGARAAEVRRALGQP